MMDRKNFWIGVVLGVAAVYAWHVYQAKKTG